MRKQFLKLSDVRLKTNDNSTGFEGYASVFDGVDSYGDTIKAGAFTATLKEHGLPMMFFNHAAYEVPIGKWVEAKEDDTGLLVRGELTPGNSKAADVGACLKHGTLTGLSIGISLKAGDYQAKDSEKPWKGYVINKVSKLVEVSVVTFPADDSARIDLTTVKSEIDAIDSISDLEDFLREAGGFSRQAAKHVVHRARSLFGLREAGQTDDEAVKQALADIAARVRSHTIALGRSK